jgi:hypothetical protein
VIEKQLRALSEQVHIISQKLVALSKSTAEKNSTMLTNNVDKRNSKDKEVWVKKEDHICLVVHTALTVLNTCLWYLDSGCFKHLIGDKTFFKELKEGKGEKITNGDDSQSKDIGKCIIEIPRFPVSQEALYVEGLKANLLSISQLCDNDFVVQFSKKECNIFYCNSKLLMEGERTVDNCYGLSGITLDPQITCNKATIDNGELWHRWLGHLNYNDLIKITNKEAVKD